MSVATQHSPFAVGSKRSLYESEENEDRLQRLESSAATKRYRARGSPARCGGPDLGLAYSVGQATFAALRGLFPEMSDKVGTARLTRRTCPSWAGTALCVIEKEDRLPGGRTHISSSGVRAPLHACEARSRIYHGLSSSSTRAVAAPMLSNVCSAVAPLLTLHCCCPASDHFQRAG